MGFFSKKSAPSAPPDSHVTNKRPPRVFKVDPTGFRCPLDTTLRSLDCWSLHGCAGDRLSDAYAARAALAAKCRYGLNRFGRLVFVFVNTQYGDGRVEHEIQSNSPRHRQDTLTDDDITLALSTISRFRK